MSWLWSHPTLYWDLSVVYRAKTATGCGWVVSIACMGNPRDIRSRAEIRGFGVTRREAFADLRTRLGAMKVLTNAVRFRA